MSEKFMHAYVSVQTKPLIFMIWLILVENQWKSMKINDISWPFKWMECNSKVVDFFVTLILFFLAKRPEWNQIMRFRLKKTRIEPNHVISTPNRPKSMILVGFHWFSLIFIDFGWFSSISVLPDAIANARCSATAILKIFFVTLILSFFSRKDQNGTKSWDFGSKRSE